MATEIRWNKKNALCHRRSELKFAGRSRPENMRIVIIIIIIFILCLNSRYYYYYYYYYYFSLSAMPIARILSLALFRNQTIKLSERPV